MSLCGNANLTIIVVVMRIKGIIDIEDKKITGQYGRFIDENLENRDHSKRNCKLIPVYEFGQQLPNSTTWTGALGLLKEKRGDLYFGSSSQMFYTDFIEHTMPSYAQRFTVAHTIENNRKLKEMDIVNLIMNFEISIKIYLISLSVLFLLTLIFISFLSTSKLNIKKLLANFFQFKLDFSYPFTRIGLTLLFYHLFLMVFKLLISNQINTSKLLVDTSYIINSMERLLKADTVVCWLKNDIEMTMAQMSPKNSNMRRLFEEKIYSNPVPDMEGELSRHCFLSMKRIGLQFDFKNKVLFINEASLYGFIASFVAPNPALAYWIDDNPLLETISVYYRRKHLTYYQKQVTDNFCLIMMQSGLSNRVVRQLIMETKKTIGDTSKIYNNLNAYIEDNTIFTNLQLSYLERFSIIILISNTLFVLIFLVKIIVFHFCRSKMLRKIIIKF